MVGKQCPYSSEVGLAWMLRNDIETEPIPRHQVCSRIDYPARGHRSDTLAYHPVPWQRNGPRDGDEAFISILHGLVLCEQSRSKDVNDLSEVPTQQQVEATTEAVWCIKMTRSMMSAALHGRYSFRMIQVTESGKRRPVLSDSKKPYDLDAANGNSES